MCGCNKLEAKREEMRRIFYVLVRLCHGCVMSPWLFNIYMDDVVGKINAIMLSR